MNIVVSNRYTLFVYLKKKSFELIKNYGFHDVDKKYFSQLDTAAFTRKIVMLVTVSS